MLPETVSGVELVWVGLSAIGVLVSWWLYRRAIRTRHYWQTNKMNGSVDINTRLNERSAGVLTFSQVAFLIAGITVMSYPSPIYEPSVDPAWVTVIPAIALISAQVALVASFILSLRDRDRLLSLEVERQRREKVIKVYGITASTSAAELARIVELEKQREDPTVPGVADFWRFIVGIRNDLRDEAR